MQRAQYISRPCRTGKLARVNKHWSFTAGMVESPAKADKFADASSDIKLTGDSTYCASATMKFQTPSSIPKEAIVTAQAVLQRFQSQQRITACGDSVRGLSLAAPVVTAPVATFSDDEAELTNSSCKDILVDLHNVATDFIELLPTAHDAAGKLLGRDVSDKRWGNIMELARQAREGCALYLAGCQGKGAASKAANIAETSDESDSDTDATDVQPRLLVWAMADAAADFTAMLNGSANAVADIYQGTDGQALRTRLARCTSELEQVLLGFMLQKP